MSTATLDRKVENQWSISEAVLIGIGAFTVFMTLLFLATREIELQRLSMKFSSYQLSMGSTLVSLIGTILALGPVVGLIGRERRPAGFWKSIGWKGAGKHVLWSALGGACLAVLFSLALTVIYGSAGYFRDSSLLFSVSLYLLTTVLTEPIVEEVYFRGILFVALAKRSSDIISIITVTLIFAFMHPGHRTAMLPVGTLLGIVRLKTRSVASCVVLHASYNLFLLLYQLFIS